MQDRQVVSPVWQFIRKFKGARPKVLYNISFYENFETF